METMKKTQAVVLSALLSFMSVVPGVTVQAEAPSTAEAVHQVPSETPSRPSDTAPPPAAAEDPRETYVLLAVLCFNEASGNELDCKAIGNIRRRYARSRGITLREALRQLHSEHREYHPERASLRSYRATHPDPEDSRPWLGDIRADLHQPLGWSGTASEWAATARVFQRLFQVTQAVEAGTVRDTCEGAPSGWGGPRVDQEALSRLREQGRTLVHCHGTANVYYRRAR